MCPWTPPERPMSYKMIPDMLSYQNRRANCIITKVEDTPYRNNEERGTHKMQLCPAYWTMQESADSLLLAWSRVGSSASFGYHKTFLHYLLDIRYEKIQQDLCCRYDSENRHPFLFHDYALVPGKDSKLYVQNALHRYAETTAIEITIKKTKHIKIHWKSHAIILLKKLGNSHLLQ